MNKMFWDSREYLWRRKEKTKNRIRIMPTPEDSKAKWWMRVDIHVVQTIMNVSNSSAISSSLTSPASCAI